MRNDQTIDLPPRTCRSYRWVWPLLVIATVCLASSNTVEAPFMPPTIIAPDKAAHLAVFGLIATLIYRALPQRRNGSTGGTADTGGTDGEVTASKSRCCATIAASTNLRCLIAIGITALFGLSDEIHQGFTPSRTFDWYDFVADISGAIIAICVYRWFHLYRRALEWQLLPCCRKQRNKAQDEPECRTNQSLAAGKSECS